MLEPIIKSAATLLLGCVLLTGCSQFTKSGRQQAAYRRYVEKYSHRKMKRQAKYKKVKMPAVQISEPMISSGLVGSPESVSSSQ